MADKAWEIRVPDNGEQVREMFEAVAMYTSSAQMGNLLYLAATVGVVGIIWAMLTKQTFESLYRYLVAAVVVLGVFYTPKVNIIVVDRSDATVQAKVVQNVPLGVGFLASATTTVGDTVAKQFETLLGIPGQERYTDGGLMWGSRQLAGLKEIRVSDGVTQRNLAEYFDRCLLAGISNRPADMEELYNQGALKNYLTSKHLNRQLSYYTKQAVVDGIRPPPTESTKSCAEAGPLIKTALEEEVKSGGRASDRAALQVYNTLSIDKARTQYFSDMGNLAKVYTDITLTAPELLLQSMMINQLDKSVHSTAASLGETEMMNYAYAKAVNKELTALQSTGRMMSSFLPNLYTIMIMLLVAVFPIVVVVTFLPGGSLDVLKNYVIGFVTLQTWPLFFVIINRIVMVQTIDQMKAAAQMSNGSGIMTKAINLQNYGELANIPDQLAAQAGGFMVAIPVLSFFIFKQMSSMGSKLESLAGSTKMATDTTAAEASSGNVSLGNLSMNRMDFSSTNGNKHNTSSALDHGHRSWVAENGVRHSVFEAGNTATDISNTQSRLLTTAGLRQARSTVFDQKLSAARDIRSQDAAHLADSISLVDTTSSEALSSLGLMEAWRSQTQGGKTQNRASGANGSHTLTEDVADGESLQFGDGNSGSVRGQAGVGLDFLGNGAVLEGVTTRGSERSRESRDSENTSIGESVGTSSRVLSQDEFIESKIASGEVSIDSKALSSWRAARDQRKEAGLRFSRSDARVDALQEMRTESATAGSSVDVAMTEDQRHELGDMAAARGWDREPFVLSVSAATSTHDLIQNRSTGAMESKVDLQMAAASRVIDRNITDGLVNAEANFDAENLPTIAEMEAGGYIVATSQGYKAQIPDNSRIQSANDVAVGQIHVGRSAMREQAYELDIPGIVSTGISESRDRTQSPISIGPNRNASVGDEGVTLDRVIPSVELARGRNRLDASTLPQAVDISDWFDEPKYHRPVYQWGDTPQTMRAKEERARASYEERLEEWRSLNPEWKNDAPVPISADVPVAMPSSQDDPRQ